jgi:hypothetical protein
MHPENKTPLSDIPGSAEDPLEVCKERNDYFPKHSKQYCKKHLLKRAGIAKEEGREEAAVQILAIIKCEQDRSFW